MKYVTGQYNTLVKDMFANAAYPMSFLSGNWHDVSNWQAEARARVNELLAYEPPVTPFDAVVRDEYETDGLVYRHLDYANPYGPRTEAIYIRPAGSEGKDLPAVLALHDHGGFKYYGKEKLTYPRNIPKVMADWHHRCYGGRAWAHELAKRGYAVFVPDLFLWGSRKIEIADMPEWYASPEKFNFPADSEEYIGVYNGFAGYMESDIAKALITAGTTWPGVFLADDMRALDWLLAQPGINTENIGCGGLSGGGLRTVFLAAMDSRVKCSVCVGFMSTSKEFALNRVQCHTWMLYVPGLTRLMDFSDLYTLRGRRPAMVQNDLDDPLFTIEGMKDADDRMRAVYERMGAPELHDGRFYPGPHKFDVEMQEDAFGFFDKWLKK